MYYVCIRMVFVYSENTKTDAAAYPLPPPSCSEQLLQQVRNMVGLYLQAPVPYPKCILITFHPSPARHRRRQDGLVSKYRLIEFLYYH